MPYDIIVYRSKIVLLGYFLNISTYGVIVLNSDLDIIGWNALNNYYPLPCHDPFPGKPQIMDDKIIATLIIINYTNTTQSISKLIEIDMSNYIMEEIISLSRIYVIDDPLVIDDTIIWGPLILNRYFNIIHNLSNKIGFIITGVWNQLLMDNMLYMILSSYSTAYIVCLDTINYNVVRVINITSTPISKLIAINNTIIGYGETLTDHMEYNITLYRIMTDKLTPIEVFNTITNSTGITIFRQNSILLLTSKIIYIVSIDKNISGVILLPHNISFENRDLDIIVFDTGDYKIDIVLLDRSYMLFLRISLEETLIPLTQHIYVHLLIITTILSLISLKGIKRRIKEVKILDQLIP